MKYIRVIWLVALSMGFCSNAAAFGDDGHSIAAMVAAELIKDDPVVSKRLRDILGTESLAQAAVYPDHHKTELDSGKIEAIYLGSDVADVAKLYAGSRDWHFDKRQVCGAFPTLATKEQWCPKLTGNACFSARYQAQRDAMTKGKRKFERQMGVRFTVHLLGDIHQPFHTGNNGNDRGGGTVTTILNKKEVGGDNKMHGFWDGDLVTMQMPQKTGQNRQQAQIAFARTLIEEFRPQFAKWRTGNAEEWVEESHKIARDAAYGSIPGFACGAKLTKASIDAAYVDNGRRIVREQLAKAGVRIAEVLTQQLGK